MDVAAFLNQHLRQTVAVVLLVGLWLGEAQAPMFPGRQNRLSHYATNLFLAVFNGLIAAGLAFALVGVTNWAAVHRFGLLNLVALPAWLHGLAALVLLDCWQYWWHRFNHRVPLLWRFHAVHHSDADMDASSGVRFHTVEMLFSFSARLAVLPLLGMTIAELLLYEAISLPVILFHHSNLRLSNRVDRSLRWLIVTPWMHFVHHSRLQPETDSNYTSFLSVWDRLFSTFRLRERPQDIALGLDGFETRDWRELPGILASPFKARTKTPGE